MTHHHHPGHVHPSPRIAPSLLRLSVGGRLVVAAVIAAVLWTAVVWAMA